jgi:endoglucanase
MGNDYNGNVGAYWNGPGASINQFNAMNIPTYVGEFMADSSTLDYMLNQLNAAGVWWSSWTLKTVRMDRWGLFNFDTNMRVDVSNDSYDTIRNKWSNMGGLTRQGVADQYQKATNNWKRDSVPSPRIGGEAKRSVKGHGGRSRRALAHGGMGSKF